MKATLLEHAVLGLLLEQPRTGYDVRRIFETTPMGNFSGGPGAIYPALKRLQGRGLIAPVRSLTASRRRKEVFRPSAAGRHELERWLRHLPTREDIVWKVEEQMLKLAFMGLLLTPAEVNRFLNAYRRETVAYARELRTYLTSLALTEISRLALEHGIALYEARARWAGRAVRAVARSTRPTRRRQP